MQLYESLLCGWLLEITTSVGVESGLMLLCALSRERYFLLLTRKAFDAAGIEVLNSEKIDERSSLESVGCLDVRVCCFVMIQMLQRLAARRKRTQSSRLALGTTRKTAYAMKNQVVGQSISMTRCVG
eukprot:5659726-Amphidinium_carterae.1